MSGSELVLKIMEGEKPTKAANALELGLSDEVWNLLEGCWQVDRALRPSIEDVSARINAAAFVCGMLLSPQSGVYPDGTKTQTQNSTSSVGYLSHSSSELEFIRIYRPGTP